MSGINSPRIKGEGGGEGEVVESSNRLARSSRSIEYIDILSVSYLHIQVWFLVRGFAEIHMVVNYSSLRVPRNVVLVQPIARTARLQRTGEE